MKNIVRLIKKFVPDHYRASYNAWKIFSRSYGHIYTLRKRECITEAGNPIPWYTYPTIDYLNQIDLSSKVVFEYGCGFSTLYWAVKAKYVFSVEHDTAWYDKIKKEIPDNVSLNLVQDLDLYQNYCANVNNNMYDIIIIDGKRRYMAALIAAKYLKDDGFIIFDNADWYPNAVRKLSEIGLKRVDFIGFGPINSYTWNTCLFFNSDYSPDFIPAMSIKGNIKQFSKEDCFF